MTLVTRIKPRPALDFDALVLPKAIMVQLYELDQRIEYQAKVHEAFGQHLGLGKGLIALFMGPSGVGKSMAAEVLAARQKIDLFSVDLSSIMSKYIGETEKNLMGVFAEADDANAILFFDEADALFGKRSEGVASHDRWANMEASFLLQRLETYSGIVVMASNLRQNIDETYLRRMQVVIEFPFPDAEARYRIWQDIFSKGITPQPDIDIRAVAERFSLTGADIKNVVVGAAIRAIAAHEEGQSTECKFSTDEQHLENALPITHQHLILAIAREYQKLGRPITPEEFGPELFRQVDEHIL